MSGICFSSFKIENYKIATVRLSNWHTVFSYNLRKCAIQYTYSALEITVHLKVHKREKFFGSDFEQFTIL
jgi:hypothetical protein